MQRALALNVLCGRLQAGLLGTSRWLREAPWPLLIELSVEHNVAPALAWCLRNDTGVPEDVRRYFDAVLNRNRTRNKRLLDSLARVVGILNALDIEPVLMKGAGLLVERIYPTSAIRVIGDLDLLIPQDRASCAFAALESHGFLATRGLTSDDHLHLPPLREPETNIEVEIHTRVVGHEVDGLVPTSWFRELARPISFRSLRVQLPQVTPCIAHSIVHSQFQHANRVELRPLLDVAVLRARQEQAIDWAEIDRRFSAAGLADVLATYLEFAERAFDQPAPKVSGVPSSRFIFYRVTLDEPQRQFRLRAPTRKLDQIRPRLVRRMAGLVEEIVSTAEGIVVRGWAVDFAAMGAARSVQIFAGDRHVAAVVPTGERFDVAANYWNPAVRRCGFQVASKVAPAPCEHLQAFAELRGGIYAELRQRAR